MNADLTEKKCDINFEKIHNFLKVYIKMKTIIIKIDDIQIQNKRFINIKDLFQ